MQCGFRRIKEKARATKVALAFCEGVQVSLITQIDKKIKSSQKTTLYFGPSGETCELCPQFATQNPDYVRLRRGSSSLACNLNKIKK